MSIQPGNKAVLGRKRERKKAVNAYLIKTSEGGGGGVLSQAVGRTGRSSIGV